MHDNLAPNTLRLSSPSRPRSKSASATSVSKTGVNPAVILANASLMLRLEPPTEPKMRYCCWNRCMSGNDRHARDRERQHCRRIMMTEPRRLRGVGAAACDRSAVPRRNSSKTRTEPTDASAVRQRPISPPHRGRLCADVGHLPARRTSAKFCRRATGSLIAQGDGMTRSCHSARCHMNWSARPSSVRGK